MIRVGARIVSSHSYRLKPSSASRVASRLVTARTDLSSRCAAIHPTAAPSWLHRTGHQTCSHRAARSAHGARAESRGTTRLIAAAFWTEPVSGAEQHKFAYDIGVLGGDLLGDASACRRSHQIGWIATEGGPYRLGVPARKDGHGEVVRKIGSSVKHHKASPVCQGVHRCQ